ncbi:DUF3515 family protein [Streptomyces sp. NPDC012600]|uniref:DUF3515 domain-containing protein n=1 Tax=Kitasatospora albolonga TaxID=68173 RepID=A0ABC8BU73_9ACTN|nr:hypothetical protein B7C62_16840 [Kitasatospora albolonga]
MVRVSRARTAVVVVAAALTAGLLVSCGADSPGEGVTSAPHAKDAACERMADRYPDRLGGQELTFTDRPGVAVWGDNAIVLRCGVELPVPTIDPCATVEGVDWVFREDRSKDGGKVVVTYGRDPAVEAVVSDGVAAVDDVLVDLSALVEPVKTYTKCVNDEDVPPPPSPSPSE